MSDDFSPRSSTTNVYTFDTRTGKLSYATMRPPQRSLSHSTSSEGPSRTHGSINADVQMPTLGKGSLKIVEEIPIRNGRTVYFVAKLDSPVFPRQGFIYGLDSCIRRAKRHVVDMERLVWKLEAALAEEDGADYEADVDEPEDEAIADSGYESDDEGRFDISGVTTVDPSPPDLDKDSRRAQDFDADGGPAGDPAVASLSSDSSDESITFDPPSSSASRTEELAPSAISATHPYAPLQSTSPSVSALSSDDYSAIDDPSMVAGDATPPPLPHLESSCADGSLSIEVPGLGCPPTEEVPLCPACYGGPIRLVWGDGSSEESLSDLVDDLLGEIDCPFDEFEAGALAAAQPSESVDAPICSPIIAADWSLSHALASVAHQRKTEAISGAGSSSSSMSNLFSERQEARAEPESESDEEPLADAVKRRRRRTGKDATSRRRKATQARGTPESDESVEIPLSTLRALRVSKGKARYQPAIRQSCGGSMGPSPAIQQDPPSESRRRKRRREDEKEGGEISVSDRGPGSESEPDIPLSQVLASRGTSQSTLGHGPPPAKRRRCVEEGTERRLSSRESGRSRRSWVHRRWEERLRLRHARGVQEGRRGIRIMSTDETLLRRGMRAAMALHRGVASS
ncbi:hypothetical protein V8D89_015645 [Ganoderma adspersum]